MINLELIKVQIKQPLEMIIHNNNNNKKSLQLDFNYYIILKIIYLYYFK